MERSSDYDKLAAALAEVRPAPSEEFARELDERVAAEFPRRSGLRGVTAIRDRLRLQSPRRLALASASAVVLIAAATAAIAIVADGGRARETAALDNDAAAPAESAGSTQFSEPLPLGGATGAESDSVTSSGGESFESSGLSPHNRKVERSARIVLLADPADVAGDSADVFAAVHDVGGIVLHSTTAAGEDANARFDLLVPSSRLGEALAAFSAIDEVGSRHEATDDITAPTVSARERLRDSQARIDGLLGRLAAAESEAEMVAIETQLRRERRQGARLRARLDRLKRRASFSRVSLRIETRATGTDSGGTWSVGDAFDDAERILAVAAGVILLALAVSAPIALLALLAWLVHRTWLRRSRRRALA